MKSKMTKPLKTLLTLFICAALITFAPFSPTAFASNINKTAPTAASDAYTGTGNAASLSVHANITGTDVISVNLSWGTLVYSYANAGWNPSTLTSEGSAGWVAQETGVSDRITVDNRSNVPIIASFSYVKESIATNFADVVGTITPATLNLQSAITDALEANRKKAVALTLAGEPTTPNPVATFTTIGYVTVTIAKDESGE